MRRRDALPDPEVDRGLRELEAALAGEPAADPDLALLVADVAAARPEPDAAFLASLDARVHAGFPQEAPRRIRVAPWWRRRALVLGPVAIAALSALVVVVGIRLLTHSEPLSQDLGSTSSASRSVPAAKPAVSQAAAASTPQLESSGRAVERAASLTLTTTPGDVQDTADGVVRATQAAGGYVQQSSVATRDRAGSAQFTLRIPSARLDAALQQLARLAHVGALDQSTTDITAQTNDARDRLQEAQAERRALLRALGAATTSERIASLKARLADNRRAIAARQAQLSTTQRRAQLATVSVQVEGRTSATSHVDTTKNSGPWSPGDALHDAGRVLAVALGVLLIALAVLLPIAVVAGLAALAARRLRRHRREAALDGSGA